MMRMICCQIVWDGRFVYFDRDCNARQRLLLRSESLLCNMFAPPPHPSFSTFSLPNSISYKQQHQPFSNIKWLGQLELCEEKMIQSSLGSHILLGQRCYDMANHLQWQSNIGFKSRNQCFVSLNSDPRSNLEIFSLGFSLDKMLVQSVMATQQCQ